jgi:hypothetical protein
MSGFFGIFRPQGGSVDLEAFEQMRKATERDGFDGMETHVEEKIAMGHLMLRVSPESKYDKQPLKSSCGNYLLVGHFRLDYRDELGDKLGLTQSELVLTPDSQLAMLSYQKWKEKCVHHIEGDWAFIIYEREYNNIVLIRDKVGISSIYYFFVNDVFVFSDEISGIERAFYSQIQIDLKQFSRVLIPYLKVENGCTLLKGVFQLLPGQILKIYNNLNLQESKVDFFESFMKIKFRYDLDYVLQFESVLMLSILSRSRNETGNGLYLSSGHDSSCVMYFLARELEYKKSVLSTFTSKPFFTEKFTQNELKKVDESLIVFEYVKRFSNIKPFVVDFPDFNFLNQINKLDSYQYQYPIITPNQYWVDAIASKAQKLQIRTMFTGQRGNFTLSVVPYNYFLELLINSKIIRFLKEIFFLRSYSKKSFRFLIGTYLKTPIFKIIKWYFSRNSLLGAKRTRIDFPWMGQMVKKNFSNKKLKEESFLNENTYEYNSKLLRTILFNYYKLFSTTAWWYVGKRSATQIVDPTSDERFVKTSFSIPEEMFFKKGMPKYIFKEMMKNKPEFEILMADYKRIQSMDLGFRVENDQTISSVINELDNNCNKQHSEVKYFYDIFKRIKEEKKFQIKFNLAFDFIENLSLLHFINKNSYLRSKQKI